MCALLDTERVACEAVEYKKGRFFAAFVSALRDVDKTPTLLPTLAMMVEAASQYGKHCGEGWASIDVCAASTHLRSPLCVGMRICAESSRKAMVAAGVMEHLVPTTLTAAPSTAASLLNAMANMATTSTPTQPHALRLCACVRVLV